MDELPRITLVTPSYNQSIFLRETIDSVLNQAYPNLEYIIVDGGSTDHSLDIIREYQDRIAWWVSEKDSGQSEAINKGFVRGTGELLGWINSDDILLPGCLHEIANCYLKKNKPDLIHANCIYIDQRGTVTRFVPVPKQTRFFLNHGVWFAPSQTSFFKKTLLREVGYLDLRYHLAMDLDIWLRMLNAGAKVAYIPKYLGAYRFHPTSKTVKSIRSQPSKTKENLETRNIFDNALRGSTENSRWRWRMVWRLYQAINFNYLQSLIGFLRFRGKNWKEVFPP